MLTKQDLEAIGGVIREEAKVVIKEELKPFIKELKNLKDQVEDLEIKLEEKISDLNMDVFHLRAELKDEAKNIKRRLNNMYKDQEVIISFFNKEYLGLLKRVEKIEGQVSLLA